MNENAVENSNTKDDDFFEKRRKIHKILLIITLILLFVFFCPIYIDMIFCGFSKERFVKKHIEDIYNQLMEGNKSSHGRPVYNIEPQEPLDIKKIADESIVWPVEFECHFYFVNKVDGKEYCVIVKGKRLFSLTYEWTADTTGDLYSTDCPITYLQNSDQ